MKIIVDADACPVKEEIVSVAKQYELDVVMFFDTSHVYEDGYSEVFIVDKGADSVDFALMNKIKPKDIVVSQDYGVASMALGKRAYTINQNGLEYTDFNIDSLMHRRYMNKKIMNAGGRIKGPKKRDAKQNEDFKEKLIEIIKSEITNS